MRKYFILLFLGTVNNLHAAGSGCIRGVVATLLATDLDQLKTELEGIPESEWKAFLTSKGMPVPELPLAFSRWGTTEGKTAYYSYLFKQAIGQRIANHFSKAAEQFLSSPIGREIVGENDFTLRHNMPQILLALAASGELPLKRALGGSPLTEGRVGRKAYEQLLRNLELESFDINHEKVRAWVECIKKIINEKPALWNAMNTRVVQYDSAASLTQIFSDAGFSTFAGHFKHNGWFIDPNLIPLAKPQTQVLDVDIHKLLATENGLCCGTSCGNCPAAFPQVLKPVQKGLALRNAEFKFSMQKSLDEVHTVFPEERRVLLDSLDETYRVLNTLGAKSFGIFEDRPDAWLNHHFRRDVLLSELEFLKNNEELFLRHMNHDAEFAPKGREFLNHPLIKNHPDAIALLRRLVTR